MDGTHGEIENTCFLFDSVVDEVLKCFTLFFYIKSVLYKY